MIVEYHPATVSELNAGVNFYNRRRAGLGDDFRTEVYAAISRIEKNPLMFPEVHGVRRVLLKRFPYSVIFRLVDSHVARILVIRHHRRRPGYEMKRR